MASMTAKLVASVVGKVSDPNGWAGPVALATVPVVPAVALAECGVAAVRAVGRAAGWLRRGVAAGLRALAEVIDPAPSVLPPVEYVYVELPASVEAPSFVEDEAPVILPMPSAAQATAETVERAQVETPEARALAECGGVRAAARALGVAESTLRGRLKKQGVTLPKRR